MSDAMTFLAFSESRSTLLELLGAARDLAPDAGRVTALAVGPDAEAAAEECRAHGADLVLTLAAEAAPDAGAIRAALGEAMRSTGADVVLIGATRTGMDVAAALGQQIEAPCISECTSVARDESGGIVIERRVYGGRFVARQRLDARPALLSIPPGRFARPPAVDAPAGTLAALSVEFPEAQVRVVGVSEKPRSDVDVGKAETIVAAGRGIRQREDLAILERLAQALGGVLAGSRPLTGDVDWLPMDRRIGLSGKTVKPKLYVACGVSGQIEHVVGMKGARTVVAINNDPKAPIHEEADYSLVGDLYEIVPELISLLAETPGR